MNLKAIEHATGEIRDAVGHEAAAFWDTVKKGGALGDIIDEAGKVVSIFHPGGILGAIVDRLDAIEGPGVTPTLDTHPSPAHQENVAKFPPPANSAQTETSPPPAPSGSVPGDASQVSSEGSSQETQVQQS